MRTIHTSTLILSLLAGLAGCSNTVSDSFGRTEHALERAVSCEDLGARLKRDALYKMNTTIDAQIEAIKTGQGWGYGTDDVASMDGGSGNFEGAPSSGSSEGSDSGSSNSSTDSSGSSEAPRSAPDHSDTNVQVEGVDEADIVKTDGNYLYVLHGSKLAIVNAWPTSSMSLAGTTEIEGQPHEMFVSDGSVVVYSAVQLPGDDTPTSRTGPSEPSFDGPSGYYENGTKLTVLSLNGSQASVEKELYFEGSYTSSRRIGSVVRTVLGGGYQSPVWSPWPEDAFNNFDQQAPSTSQLVAAFEQLRIENTGKIMGADLNDLLPGRYEKVNNELVALSPACSDYYVPTAGSTQDGLTQIQSLDLTALDGGLHQTQIVGESQTVYSSTGAMYLAGRNWHNPTMGFELTEDEPVSTEQSFIHKFDIASEPLRPRYDGSGTVDGSLINQFALDEHNGVLRVATTDTLASPEEWQRVNHVFTLEDKGDVLAISGALRNLAPDETIQSVRFVGERGYVVTFRQVDPLFVIELSEPSTPTVLAELKIPGFSEYMHPIADGTHLLTVGRDGTGEGLNGGIALQIFDVSNPTAPRLAHKLALPNGSSEAEYQHKAFTYYNDMLAIPVVDYNSGSVGSTLQVFDINVQSGISHRGTVDHSALIASTGGNSCVPYGYGVRRGVFIEDYIYSVSQGGIIASPLNNLSSAAATLTLPAIPNDYCYGPGGGSGSIGGSDGGDPQTPPDGGSVPEPAADDFE